MDQTGRIGYYAIRLIRAGGERGGDQPPQHIAAVEAYDMPEAIAKAMRRYPGYIAVHGERR